ncbi:MAG: ComEC/Rec2 family competence protein [Bdellovibrionales bacterium]|nr:ComEC/Rec2 family competence protein [Bdellovibrionales bacterium]
MLAKPQSMPWQDDPYSLLHRLFWNERPVDSEEGVFRIYGVVHLYATSGIHLYAFLETVELWVFPLVEWLKLDLKWMKRAALALALALLAWAWWLQDFRPGFARPLVTFMIRKWGREQGAKFRVLAPLAATLIFDWVFDFGGGKAHYYLAIAGALLALERVERRRSSDTPSPIWTHVALSVGSWILTAPLDLVMHHRISWMTPVYSLLTLPLLAHILYPASLLSLLLTNEIAPTLLRMWQWMMDALVWIADHTPGPVGVTGVGITVAVGFAMAAVVYPRFRAGLIVAALGLRLLLPEPSMIAQLNVQQGDSLLVRTPARAEMVDVGPEIGLRSSDWIEKEFEYSIDHVDAIVLTHLDADHVRGLRRLLPWMRVNCIETAHEHWKVEEGARLAREIEQESPDTKIVSSGCFQSGTLAWLRSQTDRHSGNDLMAGVVIPLAQDRVYLGLGDGDQSQEIEFAHKFSDALAMFPHRIWKLGHHGSKYSSGPEFLAWLRPERIWLSVGRKNAYHHPHPSTLERLAGLREWLTFDFQRTDVDGDLTAKISQPSRFSTREK